MSVKGVSKRVVVMKEKDEGMLSWAIHEHLESTFLRYLNISV